MNLNANEIAIIKQALDQAIDIQSLHAKFSNLTVREYLNDRLGVDIIPLQDYSLESVCGRASIDIIDKACALLAVCDPHPRIHKNIVDATQFAVEVVCLG